MKLSFAGLPVDGIGQYRSFRLFRLYYFVVNDNTMFLVYLLSKHWCTASILKCFSCLLCVLFPNVTDRVPRHCLDRGWVRAGSAGGRLFFSVRPWAGTDVSPVPLRSWFGVIGGGLDFDRFLVRLMVMPHGLDVPETAESVSQHAC